MDIDFFKSKEMEMFLYFLPYFMKAILAFIIIFALYNRKIITDAFRKISKEAWVVLLLIMVIGGILRFFIIPHEQIIATDGEGWVELGIAIKEFGAHYFCAFASANNCLSFFYPTYPPGYPTLLSIVFIFFESVEKTAFYFSAFTGTLMIFLSFLFAYIWTKKEDVALIGALSFGFIPPILKFSGSVSMEFFALFFLFLTFISLKLFLEKKAKSTFLFFLFLLLYTSYLRPEMTFLILPMLVFFFVFKEFKTFFNEHRFFLISSFVLFFISLLPAFLMIYLGSQIWHDWSPSFLDTIIHFFTHLPQNLFFFINPLVNLLPFALIAIMGGVLSFLWEKRSFFVFAFFLLFYFGFYTAFEVGDFSHPQFVRYALVLYVPIFYFFIQGLIYCQEKIKNKNTKNLLTIILFLSLTINIIYSQSYVFQRETFHNPAKETLYKAKELIPRDAYMVASERKFVRPVIKRDFISIYELINGKNNKKIEGKRLFLFNPGKHLMGRPETREALYEQYDFSSLKTTDRIREDVGVYELIKKE